MDNLSGGEGFVNPLGNKFQYHHGDTQGQLAVYQHIKKERKKLFSAVSPLTLRSPRSMVAADKGTVRNYFTRQAIVATYIGPDGVAKEILLSARALEANSAFWSKNDLKDNCKEYFDLKNIKNLFRRCLVLYR